MERLPIEDAPRDGMDILSYVDGEWMLLRWYDTTEETRNGHIVCDTDTYAAGWISGERHSEWAGMNICGRLKTFDPTHFYKLPKED